MGLTNGTENIGLYTATASSGNVYAAIGAYGKLTGEIKSPGTVTISDTSIGVTTEAIRSGMIADLKNATVETIPCKWFIQVATGVEESVDVTREIELNNPFSLLDYKWSEYEITNASWLLSNGQFNSGSTYVSVYNLLLEIYNGTVTKEGVSVKMSSEAYNDADFVLNTSDVTFRLPIKIDLAGDSIVSGLNLYFYVGETIQDANVIAASQVLTKVANCIDRTVKSDRETVVGWGMPDYSAPVIVSNPFTCPTDGYLKVFWNGNYTLKVDGVQQAAYEVGSGTTIGGHVFIPLSKGSVIESTISCKFYPCIGAK